MHLMDEIILQWQTYEINDQTATTKCLLQKQNFNKCCLQRYQNKTDQAFVIWLHSLWNYNISFLDICLLAPFFRLLLLHKGKHVCLQGQTTTTPWTSLVRLISTSLWFFFPLHLFPLFALSIFLHLSGLAERSGCYPSKHVVKLAILRCECYHGFSHYRKLPLGFHCALNLDLYIHAWRSQKPLQGVIRSQHPFPLAGDNFSQGCG